MKNNITTDEKPSSIVISIILLYGLIEGFFFYLYALHRIDFTIFIICTVLLVFFYIPRFRILKNMLKGNTVNVSDTTVVINSKIFLISDIVDFRIEEKKTKILFFFNNKMVVYNEAKFHLKFDKGVKTFTVHGREKIGLLKEFLTILVKKNLP